MIQIKAHSGIFTLTCETFLPVNLEHAWHFFSSPVNLGRITPPHMNFQITSELEKEVYPGQIISYRVNVLPFLRLNWVTEITQVQPGQYFIDEQRFGPYRMWHHLHRFEETAQGLKMTDQVIYKLPLGILGKWMHPLVVQPQLIEIFNYRSQVLNNIFN